MTESAKIMEKCSNELEKIQQEFIKKQILNFEFMPDTKWPKQDAIKALRQTKAYHLKSIKILNESIEKLKQVKPGKKTIVEITSIFGDVEEIEMSTSEMQQLFDAVQKQGVFISKEIPNLILYGDRIAKINSYSAAGDYLTITKEDYLFKLTKDELVKKYLENEKQYFYTVSALKAGTRQAIERHNTFVRLLKEELSIEPKAEEKAQNEAQEDENNAKRGNNE